MEKPIFRLNFEDLPALTAQEASRQTCQKSRGQAAAPGTCRMVNTSAWLELWELRLVVGVTRIMPKGRDAKRGDAPLTWNKACRLREGLTRPVPGHPMGPSSHSQSALPCLTQGISLGFGEWPLK